MNTTVLTSTFLLTLLLMVGLFFFVKASVKDRTQQIRLVAEQSRSVLDQLKHYFTQRAYRVTAADQESIMLEGLVRPSVFLAVFLTLLVAASLLCSALVLSALFPQASVSFLLLPFLSPLASWFYWQRAERLEQVCLKIEPSDSSLDNSGRLANQVVIVTAHRDELIELERALKLHDLPESSIGTLP